MYRRRIIMVELIGADLIDRNERARQYLVRKSASINSRNKRKLAVSFYNRLFIFFAIVAWARICILWLGGFSFGLAVMLSGAIGLMDLIIGAVLIGKHIIDAFQVD
jgi:hypothetical protein